jgi:hypothetical protein
MKHLAVLILAVTSLFATPSLARSCTLSGPVSLYNGFGNGEGWLKENEAEARGYVRGFVNGMFISLFYKADESCVARSYQCLVGKTDSQLAAILRKYLNDNPDKWDSPLPGLTYTA